MRIPLQQLAMEIAKKSNKLKRLNEMVAALKLKLDTMAELGRDDPRRLLHSLKVGVALSLVSLVYYCKPIYDYFGVSAMWAVMTVVVLSEFSVGATLGKAVNRGIATLLGGSLGVAAHYVAHQLRNDVGEAVVIGLLVFLFGAMATYVRFVPEVKARYDYALLVFILTFSFVTVSGYRHGDVLEEAKKRLSTVMVGASVYVVVSIVLFPVWAGEDLQNLVALNLEKLGNFLEGFGDEYFRDGEFKAEDLVSLLQDYRSILNSKDTEVSLANYARWEPYHGRFQSRHPWNLYLQIGTLARQCAYTMEALNRYLTVHSPVSVRAKIKDPGTKTSRECGRTLRELSMAIKAMCQPCAADAHIEAAKAAAEELKSGVWWDEGTTDLLQVTPMAAVACLLIDVVSWVKQIADATAELASEAGFKRLSSTDHVAITVGESNVNSGVSVV